MPLKSPIDIPSCPRCSKMIPAGSNIERSQGEAQKKGSWVHVGCKAPIPAKKVSATPPTKKADLPGHYETFNPDPALAKPTPPAPIVPGLTWVTEEVSDHSINDEINSGGHPIEREYGESTEKDSRVAESDNPQPSLFSEEPEDREDGHGDIYTEDEAGGAGVEVLDESGSEGDGDAAIESDDGEDGESSVADSASDDPGFSDHGGESERGGDGLGDSDEDEDGEDLEDDEEDEDENGNPNIPEPSIESSGEKKEPNQEPEEGKPVEAPTVQAQPKKPAAPNMSDVVKQAGEIAAKRVAEMLESRLSKMIHETAEPITNNLVKEVVDKLKVDLKREFSAATDAVRKDSTEIIAKLKAEIDRRVEDEVKKLDSARPVILKIEHPDGSAFEFAKEDIFHSAFPEAMKLASNGFNVFLPGPSGCGKTMMSAQIAKGLGLEFAMVSGSSGTTETELFGYSMPNVSTGQNVYIESDFVRVYENGGCFLADEVDAMDANCVLKLNAAMSNGFCTVPKRYGKTRAVRHPRFVLIAAANTYGSGATRLYCGRNRLDESTLDRLRSGCVPMDYDPAIERRICPNVKLYEVLTRWRKNIVDAGLQRILSTRFVSEAYKLKMIGYTDEGIAKKLTGGWTAPEVIKVIGKPLAV